MQDGTEGTSRNEVTLVGRLAAPALARELPSGDALMTFRVVVDRPPSARSGRTTSIDTVDCAAYAASVRRSAGAWQAGDVVEVQGALRRRFWRGPHGPASRYEVEVSRAKRLTRAA